MHRQIVYNGQLPLETDVLNTNLYAMVGLGRLAMDMLGSVTVASGLACTPTTPASMSVNIGAGALYSLENVDNTAYSSLPADTTDQIVKQGLVMASDASSLAMTAPTTAGYSVVYLIQGSYEDVDTGAAVLNYYDAADPSVPYTGPNNNSASQPTERAGKVGLVAKAGIPAASPVAPTADTGYSPLYTVTIAYGQTSITSGNIAVAADAPFLAINLGNLIEELSSYLTTAAAAATYAPLSSIKTVKYGTVTLPNSGAATSSVAATFPTAFPSSCDFVAVVAQGQVNSPSGGNPILTCTWDKNGFTVIGDTNTGHVAAGAGQILFNQTVTVAYRAEGS